MSINAREGEAEIWLTTKLRLLALSSPHQALADPNTTLVFTWTLITLFSWSRPHTKQMSMSHIGEVFKKELKYWSCQCFDLVDKASRQLGLKGRKEQEAVRMSNSRQLY